MYLDHFRLSCAPFGLTPDPNFRVNLPTHHEAMNVVRFAVGSGEGFVKITGEVGTGKTLLCRHLLAELPEAFVTAYLPDPMLSPLGVRKAFAQELGVPFPRSLDAQELLEYIREALVEIHQEGRSVLLIVDEAQALSNEGLESIRLLTNLETRRRKLLQVLLVGQPELDARLHTVELRQLAQRITFSHVLQRMRRREVREYVDQRLIAAGRSDGEIFTGRAIATIHRASAGIPRLVNVLCHKALMAAYGRGEARVGGRSARRAVADSAPAVRLAPSSGANEPPRWEGTRL
ncbi:MAG: AAA family ATPase [bacterium]|nr:AAA family ATPase [bacterium]